MNLNNLSENRIINKTNVETPILVPSFSSKGFPNIKQIHGYLQSVLVDASLVSAYDLYYNNVDKGEIYCSDIVFVDSGGYESKYGYDISDVYQDCFNYKKWTPELHEEEIKSIKPLTQIVIVSYDYDGQPAEVQIKNAQTFFNKYEEYSSDFLFKSTKDKKIFDFDEWVKFIDEYKNFDILGFTEKELGESILQRCINIIKIRSELIKKQFEIPLHIFGSIDPLSVIAYFICGADIFDGLSWLRYYYDEDAGAALYINNNIISEGCWEMSMEMVNAYTYIHNIKVLTKLIKNMKVYIKCHDIRCFDIQEKYIIKIEQLVDKAFQACFEYKEV